MRAYFFAMRIPVHGLQSHYALLDLDRLAGSKSRRLLVLIADIHPKFETVRGTCSCGFEIVIRYSLCEDLHIDVCSQCHPFFTGKQKIVDSGGRVDRFKKRFGSRGAKR